MKTYLLTILGLLISFPLTARDFSYTYEGNTLIYTVLDENAKTCEVKKGYDASGKLTIPETAIDGLSKYSVVAINSSAFCSISGITSVMIPVSITKIPSNPFLGHTSLIEINVDPDNPNFTSYKGALFNKELTELIAVGGGRKGKFMIPNSVELIGMGAFGGCMKLKSVTIPNSVSYIGAQAFVGCYELTSVTIPASVIQIESLAFMDCRSLTEINVDPDNLHYASFEGSLYNKEKTVLLEVGGGKKGEFAVPDFVKAIRYYAFAFCNYVTSVTVPGSVVDVGLPNFFGCKSLTDIYVAPDNPNYASFEGVLYNKDKSILVRVCEGRKGQFVIPSSVEKIGYCAVYSCDNLTSVFIPGSITEIDRHAFAGSDNLKKIYCDAENPPSCAEDAFIEYNYEECTLYVPVGAKSVYEQADPWHNFKNIVESDFAGIDAVADSESSVSLKVEHGRIFVMNKPAESAVKVYTTQGRMVAQTCSDEVSVLPSGIYIVTVGARSFKVAI